MRPGCLWRLFLSDGVWWLADSHAENGAVEVAAQASDY